MAERKKLLVGTASATILPTGTIETLKQIADEEGTSMREVLEEALTNYIQEQTEARDAAQHLIRDDQTDEQAD